MLRFANKPDEIFLILIDETIEDFLDELEGFNDDPTEQEEIIKASMPRSAALFTIQQLNSATARPPKSLGRSQVVPAN